MLSKVIIEAALLTDDEKVTACTLAKAAGADYVKTSTGFGPGGATAADVALMRRVVGADMGVKAAGGVRDLEGLKAMVAAGATRVGASAGVKIVQQARGEKRGGGAPGTDARQPWPPARSPWPGNAGTQPCDPGRCARATIAAAGLTVAVLAWRAVGWRRSTIGHRRARCCCSTVRRDRRGSGASAPRSSPPPRAAGAFSISSSPPAASGSRTRRLGCVPHLHS